jgi:hypothetical protein
MTPRQPLTLAALGKLLKRVSSGGVEQPIAPGDVLGIRRDERFGDQAEKAVGNLGCGEIGACETARAAPKVNVPAKIAKRRRITRSGSGSSS